MQKLHFSKHDIPLPEFVQVGTLYKILYEEFGCNYD